MFYIYIIYSESADKYYIGHTSDPLRRLKEHNEAIKNSFTSHYRPWVMKRYFIVSESRGETKQIENYLKRLKSRVYLERLINSPEEFESMLRKVRAIPTSRN
ncbi:MAG: GIY-YIG nuclease family protein [Bacteroidales bacterium]|jgi:putative endonuclease